MKKNLGDKGKEISYEQIRKLVEIYKTFEEGEFCKIRPNKFFGYSKVTIEKPLIKNGEIQKDKKGNLKLDPNKRDTERIPLLENVEEYFNREVLPYSKDAWMDRKKDKVGYEINFTKYFYKFEKLRNFEEISNEIISLDKEIFQLSNEYKSE